MRSRDLLLSNKGTEDSFGKFRFIGSLYPKDLPGFCGGCVIQATGTVEFEYGLWIGNHLKAQNGLQRACTIPRDLPGAVRTLGLFQGQTEFQYAWVRMAAWF